MSSLEASNGDEPPKKKLQPSSSSLFSSLPRDMVLNILARVPKRYYPIISCVSKNLRSLVKSSDMYKTRSLLGKEDYLHICFTDSLPGHHEYWYTLRRVKNSETENLFESINLACPPDFCAEYKLIAVGSEIFFIPRFDPSSSVLWILDTKSGELRQGPSLLVERMHNSVGLVGGKIFVVGGAGEEDEIQAESFDLKTQTWEAAPIPDEVDIDLWIYGVNVSFDRKVVTLHYSIGNCYDTRDGSCEITELPDHKWCYTVFCVIDNVLYIYFTSFGLMWYDSEQKLWRVVYGLKRGKLESVGMAEYYGKLAFVWEKPSLACSERKEIWCRMIGLVWSEEEIHGIAEPSQLLETLPNSYQMCYCLSLSS